MRILLSSRGFHPAIGGVETASLFLAKGFAARGYDITVVTATPGDDHGYGFRVVRCPNAAALMALVRDAELVWHSNISLRTLWPLAVLPRPLLVTHHTWFGGNPRNAALKRWACARGRNVFVSRALAEGSGLPATVIPNAYDEATFRLIPDLERDRDVAFVGRLVSDKGADLLIDALAILAARGRRIGATIIGNGSEADSLKARAAAAGLGDVVAFPGSIVGTALARELNRHRILAVPSRWNEPFGIVALEGAACGCVVIGTEGGGLPEAIGPCGPIVPKNDAGRLADSLALVMGDPAAAAAYRQQAPAHLAKFRPAGILDAYEAILADMVKR